MSSKTHWSERTTCSCGATFKYPSLAEARHRHNFPLLCRKRKKPLPDQA